MNFVVVFERVSTSPSEVKNHLYYWSFSGEEEFLEYMKFRSSNIRVVEQDVSEARAFFLCGGVST